MKRLGTAATIALCVGLLSGAPALAGDTAKDGARVTVSYGDLDLSHQTGAQVLISRLDAAATKVCGGSPDIRDLTRLAKYRTCHKDAMDGAITSLNHPMVNALYGLPMQRVAEQ